MFDLSPPNQPQVVLRPYQREAVEALYGYFAEHNGNPLVVLPTGTGKSIVIAEFVRDAIARYPDTRIMMVTHVKELIQQNFSALLKVWPTAPAGIYSAGLNARDMHSQILFCGIQSVHRKARNLGYADMIIVDEAHTISRNSASMYGSFFAAMRELNPWLKVVGFTATAYRLDSGMLNEGKGALFSDIAYEANISDMIDQGYLSPLRTCGTSTDLDVSGVRHRGGEFVAGELERAVNTADTNEAIVREIIARGADRRAWLCFCTGKDHAEAITELLRENVTAACITDETPNRTAIIAAYKAGEIRALVNVNVLTTGFDAPQIDLIAMIRPTESVGLYVQMLGRGARLSPGKADCLVLDFAGNIRRHGPIDMVRPKRPGEGGGVAPVKECPDCEAIIHAAARACPHCGYEFPPPEPELSAAPDTAPVLSRDIAPEWIDVTGVSYARHEKFGKPPSMRVEYQCGLLTAHREWVCFEHAGYARQKAASWWLRRAAAPVPGTVEDALSRTNELRTPKQINVRLVGKYAEIVGSLL